jgi:Holliday junction resolvase
VADILAFRGGVYLAIETKMPGRESRVTEAQKEFLATWAEHGGKWLIVSSLDDLLLEIGEAA